MTTNMDRAVNIIAGAGNCDFCEMFDDPGESCAYCIRSAETFAQALADAGLLMPDHPEPNSTIDGEPSWEVKREDKHFEIGMYNDFSGITFDNYTTGAMISLPPFDMREAAYALLAAADYAEQEQGNGS